MIARVKDLMQMMEENFPANLAEEWDNTGLQVGDPGQTVNRLLIALDLDQAVLEQALEQKADMVITHHPLIFKALKKLDYSQPHANLIRRLIQAGISVYSAHTNLDAAPNGLNQYLAERLELTEIKPLFPAFDEELFKIVVYVPVSHAEMVREAMTGAGAGHIGRYSDCTFGVQGIGTFRPGADTNPYSGKSGQLERAEEYRLETVAYKSMVPTIIAAMEKVHPYEEVAYDLYQLENRGRSYCPGRQGRLSQVTVLAEYARRVKEILELDHIRVIGDLQRKVKKIAVVSGSGASFIDVCLKQGADLLVTGDIKYHEAKDAQAAGLAIIDAGHQGTEQIAVSLLSDLLSRECGKRGIDIKVIGASSPPCFLSV